MGLANRFDFVFQTKVGLQSKYYRSFAAPRRIGSFDSMMKVKLKKNNNYQSKKLFLWGGIDLFCRKQSSAWSLFFI